MQQLLALDRRGEKVMKPGNFRRSKGDEGKMVV